MADLHYIEKNQLDENYIYYIYPQMVRRKVTLVKNIMFSFKKTFSEILLCSLFSAASDLDNDT